MTNSGRRIPGPEVSDPVGTERLRMGLVNEHTCWSHHSTVTRVFLVRSSIEGVNVYECLNKERVLKRVSINILIYTVLCIREVFDILSNTLG